MLDIAALTPWLASAFLHFVRIGAFFIGQPMFGVQRDSKTLRLVLMVSLGSLFFMANGMPAVHADGLGDYAALVVREMLIGLALGFTLRLFTSAMSTAGEILGHEMGFSMARIADPATGRSAPVISQLFETIAFLLVFELDIHHHVLLTFSQVYEILPVGSGFDPEPVARRLTALVGDTIQFGMRFALPVLGVMILLTASLVMLARAIPNINLLEFAFGVRILLSLLAASYFLTAGVPMLEGWFEYVLEKARLLFAGM